MGAWPIGGALGTAWAKYDRERSPLGHPASTEGHPGEGATASHHIQSFEYIFVCDFEDAVVEAGIRQRHVDIVDYVRAWNHATWFEVGPDNKSREAVRGPAKAIVTEPRGTIWLETPDGRASVGWIE